MRKLLISNRYLVALILVLTFSNIVFSQNETYSVPAKWEYYSVKDKKVSILMPRLPVLIKQGNLCLGEESRNYAAYNDGVAYVLRITSKVKPSDFCSRKKDFDENSFLERVKSVKAEVKDESKSENNISKDSIIKLVGTGKVIKLINDYENKRWFELSIYGADEKKDEVEKFLSSLKTDNNPSGIEIGPGAQRVFGDDASSSLTDVQIKNGEKVETVKQILVKTADTSTKGVGIILKARANYSDAARQTKVQGKVVLRVNFQANGAIGSIAVVSGLPYGLTEEAIKAARKIVFTPAQANGMRVSVAKPVEYSFSIY